MEQSRAEIEAGRDAVMREHPDVYFAGFLQDAQKEYAEARLTEAIVAGFDLPSIDELDVDIAPYLNGMSESIGEGRRAILDLLRRVDAIYLEEIRAAGLYDQIWQAFAVLLPIKSVGVMGDGRTYDHVVALRAVTSRDGMTADWFPFPHDVLGRISNRIINEVRGVNRVAYDVSSKPPATIEWE